MYSITLIESMYIRYQAQLAVFSKYKSKNMKVELIKLKTLKEKSSSFDIFNEFNYTFRKNRQKMYL